MAVLPNTTESVQITPRVPLVLPKSEVPYYVKQKQGLIDCTSDLECNFPQKCCNGQCKDRIMIDQVRNGNLFSPQRIGVCPPSQFRKPCQSTSGCQSDHLCCRGTSDQGGLGRCQAEPTYFYGGFEGHYLNSHCQKIKDKNFCHSED